MAGNTDQDQTLEGLDPLASDIAHDLNNVLQVVLGYSGLLLNTKTKATRIMWISGNRPGRRQRRSLVQRLLTLGKKVVPQVSHSNEQ